MIEFLNIRSCDSSRTLNNSRHFSNQNHPAADQYLPWSAVAADRVKIIEVFF